MELKTDRDTPIDVNLNMIDTYQTPPENPEASGDLTIRELVTKSIERCIVSA